MTAIFDAIQRFVTGFVELLKQFGYWFLDFVYGMLESLFYFFFDKFCDLVEWFFLLIDFKNDLFQTSLAWSSMPDQMIYILNQVGFDNGLLIITSAILIRLTLNLIPTWATRV